MNVTFHGTGIRQKKSTILCIFNASDEINEVSYYFFEVFFANNTKLMKESQFVALLAQLKIKAVILRTAYNCKYFSHKGNVVEELWHKNCQSNSTKIQIDQKRNQIRRLIRKIQRERESGELFS